MIACSSDACSTVDVSSDYDFGNFVYTCGESGSITVTYTMTDVCGNETVKNATFTIVDTAAPITPAAPADELVECGADVPAAIDLTAVDNCDGDITVSPTEVITPGECANSYTLVRTWTFTDGCGNTSEVSQTITVNDTTAPVTPAAPADELVECGADVPVAIDLTAVDNCEGDITVSPTEVITPGDCDNSYVIVRTWTFTDGCDNTSEVSQTITVNDTTEPVAPAAPADELVECADEVPSAVDLTAVDNCDGDITVSPIEVVTPGDCPNSYVIVRTWTFVDGCDNTSEVSQTITVNDITAVSYTHLTLPTTPYV